MREHTNAVRRSCVEQARSSFPQRIREEGNVGTTVEIK